MAMVVVLIFAMFLFEISTTIARQTSHKKGTAVYRLDRSRSLVVYFWFHERCILFAFLFFSIDDRSRLLVLRRGLSIFTLRHSPTADRDSSATLPRFHH